MFKLVVLSALLAVAAARPSLLHSSPLVYSTPLVGTIVKSVPTAVSHQSSAVVHSSGHLVQPIVAPVLKTYASPSLLHSSPIISSPLTYSSPIHYGSPSYGYSSGIYGRYF